jgi:uncharacterized protein YndB with AHSA1/START domain
MTHPMTVDLSSPKDMVLVREFDAPRALVWQCWTDPAHLIAWWGPEAFANEVDLDLRPGGHQNITMIGPDGTRLPVNSIYLDIVEKEKIVFAAETGDLPAEWHALFAEHSGGLSDGKFRLVTTVTFEETDDGRTRVTVRQTFPAQPERDANMKMGAEQGWRESFAKLDRHLETFSA